MQKKSVNIPRAIGPVVATQLSGNGSSWFPTIPEITYRNKDVMSVKYEMRGTKKTIQVLVIIIVPFQLGHKLYLDRHHHHDGDLQNWLRLKALHRHTVLWAHYFVAQGISYKGIIIEEMCKKSNDIAILPSETLPSNRKLLQSFIILWRW